MANESNGGVFELHPKEDPLLARVVPAARRKVQMDKSLPLGARVFFDYLTDCSLWPGHNVRPGIVRFSNYDLAQKFGVCEKTIQNWKALLRSRSAIWTTGRAMKNMYPMTQYHITDIVGQCPLPFAQDVEDGYMPQDENRELPSNRKRPESLARLPKGSLDANGKPNSGQWVKKSAQASVANAVAEINLPSTAANGCRPQRQPVAVHSGNGLPSTAANGCRPEGQMVAAVGGNGLPSTAAMDCRPGRQQIADNKEALDLSNEPSVKEKAPPGFKEWAKRLKKMFKRELEETKTALLKERARLPLAETEAISDLSARIDMIDAELFGGKLPKPKRSKPTRAVQAAQPTESEILEGARYALANGNLLLESQVRALLLAGDTLPSAVAKKFPKLTEELGRNPIPG